MNEEKKEDSFKLDNLEEFYQNVKETEENNLGRALAEVRCILNGFDENILNCIPKHFIEYIEKFYDKTYVVKVNPYEDINKQKLMNYTRAILAMIYRKYIINI